MSTHASFDFPLIDSYVKRSEVADLVGGRNVSLGDFSTGGSIGTAPNVVDGVSTIAIAQTTAAQTLTVPNPTVTTADHVFSILSTGSTSFTVFSTVLSPGSGITVAWEAVSQGYVVIGTASGSTALTITGGKTVAITNTLTFSGTDGQTMTFPAVSSTVLTTGNAQTITSVKTFSSTPVMTHLTVEGVTSTGATGTGAFVFATSPTLVTPVLGVATGTSLATSGLITSSSASAGMGYATGAGGTVTQGTSRTTAVTLSKITGEIVLFSAAGSATPFTFVVNNTTVGLHDTITVTQQTGTDVYSAVANKPIAGTSFQITITDLTGTTTEAPKFNFTITKGVAA